MQQGVKVERILDDIRDSICEDVKREHLLTRQDILNIRRQYNIEGIQRHNNDHTSLRAWVEELRSLPYDPIIIFKQQGDTQAKEMDDIGDEDFLLAIQTEFQHDMMQAFGNNIICVDSTHETIMYDFFLITVLIVDEFGEGTPVAWPISNREDGCILTQFLKISMTEQKILDDAQQYWNSWSAVYGKNNT